MIDSLFFERVLVRGFLWRVDTVCVKGGVINLRLPQKNPLISGKDSSIAFGWCIGRL